MHRPAEPRRPPTLAWVLLLLLAARPAGAAPVASADYFPLVPGTTWTYSGEGDTWTRQVQPPSPPGSSLRVLRTTTGPGAGQQETYETATSGILQHSLVGAPPDSTLITFSPPIVLLPVSVEAGNSGSQNGDVAIGATGGPGTYSYAWQVISIGPQTTPLGQACDVLEFTWTFSISAFGDTTTDHAVIRLVRGLGAVRSSGDVDGTPYDDQLTASSLPFPLDTDCDALDVCPHFAQTSSTDTDGDGRGDQCECTDQNGDGRNTVSDLIAINTAIFNPALATPLCDGNNDGLCNVNDIIAANIEIFSPTNTSTCARQPVPGP